MTLYWCILLALTIIVTGQAVKIGDSCTDGAGLPGTCQPVIDCQSIKDLLLRGNLSDDERTYLMKSQCGSTMGTRTVCCPVPHKQTKQHGSKLPSVNECGRSSDNRIVGGEIAELDEYPWLARIQYSKPFNRSGFHCGGVLINEHHVVTAAHCIESVPASWKIFQVRLGDYDSESDTECSVYDPDDCVNSVQDVSVASYLIHEDYKKENGANYNDIALIQLARPVTYNEFIQPICLPTTDVLKNRDLVGDIMTVAGWGQTETRLGSRYKMILRVPGWDNARCGEAFSGMHIAIADTQLCAGGEQDRDSCRGDAGGPLMKIEMVDGVHRWVLKGIVSFGIRKCGTENVPGVYTRISEYVDWILENM